MQHIAIIPARFGSKGIPHKNYVDLGGKPLIHWTLDAVKDNFNQIIVSSDDQRLIYDSSRLGYTSLCRAKWLSEDTTTATEVVLNVLEFLKLNKSTDLIYLLQPTSPFRSKDSIRKAKAVAMANGNVIGVTACGKTNNLIRIERNRIHNIFTVDPKHQRQDVETLYRINGSIFCESAKNLLENKKFNNNAIPLVMGIKESIEIDTMEDLEFARGIHV